MIAWEHTSFRRLRQIGSGLKKRWRITLSSMSALMLLPLILPCGQAQEAPSVKSRMVTGQVRFSKRSDAESGVQLLETIINRVMNLPQVALHDKTGSQMLAQNMKQSSQQAQAQSQGVDYKLAIRPKETGRVFANPSPSLPMLAQNELPTTNASAGGAGAGAFVSSGTLTQRQLPASRAAANLDTDELASASQTETWRGSSLSRIALNNAPSNNQLAEKPGFWDRETSQLQGATAAASPASTRTGLPSTNMGKFVHQPGDNMYQAAASQQAALKNSLAQAGGGAASMANRYARAKTEMPSFEEAKQKNPQLANSINKLYKLNKRLEDMQGAADDSAAQAPSQAPVPPSAEKTNFSRARKEIQIVDERPSVHDFREAPWSDAAGDDAHRLDSGRASGFASANSEPYNGPASPSAAPAPSRRAPSAKPQSAAVHGTLMNKAKMSEAERNSDKIAAKKDAKDSGPAESKFSRDKLALLPPNVATGIPLGGVTLGYSESQVLHSLGQIGKIKQQKIHGWNVYFWHKKDSPEGTPESLQLYFRRGSLDAIRIFDPSLISPDFGVMPGDHLEEVKERFGEPAFLLPEPGAESGGKNYIYPISQVGFQLVRRGGESSPQVASVLIFSVK